ncbi:MAG: TetR/AcrR family transcriptional regulator [Bacilli bacterium]
MQEPSGRLKIIEAAKSVIGRVGIHSATMRQIAIEADVSTGAIYHHFKSKDEILISIIDLSLSDLQQISQTQDLESMDRQALATLIRQKIIDRLMNVEENRLFLSLSHEAMNGNTVLKEKFQLKYEEWLTTTSLLLRTVYAVEDEEKVTRLAKLIIAMIDGIIHQFALELNPEKIEVLIRDYELSIHTLIVSYLAHTD